MSNLKKTLLLGLAIFSGISIFVISGIFMMNQSVVTGLSTVNGLLQESKYWFTLLRILILMSLYFWWDNLCYWFVKKKNIEPTIATKLIADRNLFMGFFILFELVINQNVLGYAINLLRGIV